MALRPATTITGLAGLVLVCLNLGALHLVLSEKTQAIEQTRAESLNISTLLARQTDRTFQAVEVIEANVVGRLRSMGIASGDDLRWMGSQRIFHERIVGEIRQLEFLTGFTILDDRGQVIATSQQWPAPDVNLSARDCFQALSSTPELETFVGRPIADPKTGELSIHVARKIKNAEGRFAGLVMGGVRTDAFRAIYDEIQVRDGGAIFLVRDDGIVLSQSGTGDTPLGFAILNPRQVENAVVHDGGAVTFLDDELHDWKLNAVAELRNFPLRVVVGIPLGSVLESWRGKVWITGLLVCFINASSLLATFLGLRRLRESERIRDAEHRFARQDVLTSLPNRSAFQEQLAEIRAGNAGETGFGLILLDLDNFKEVNDSQGHQAGDQLLQLVGRRLAGHVRKDAFLARLGGDEFAILQSGVTNEREILDFGRAILSEFQRPFAVEDRVFAVGATLGAAFGRPGEDEAVIFDQADMALYQAKEAGRNTIRFFSAELDRERRARKSLVADLRQGVEARAFELHYQPIVDLVSCRLVAFEALLRWTHPVRGAVPPSIFIPVAEETGLIAPLGSFALREACRQTTRWPHPIKVAVNLSSVQLRTGDIVSDVKQALADSGLDPWRLEIEITESTLLDVPRAQPILHELRALGVSISLDDFGTGYSSLSYLRSFPFHRLKVDRSFVSELASCNGAASIVETIKALGDQLGMAVTAEGIETHDQLRRLQGIGAMTGQGFLFSRPVPAADTDLLIREFGIPDESVQPDTGRDRLLTA